MSDPIANIAAEINARREQVAATVKLLDEGNTIPFMARYRKEATGGLDEEQLRTLADRLAKSRALEERRQTVLKTIADQGKLTAELHAQLFAVDTVTALEDLYQPYKPKRRTRASAAREKGLEGLAKLILQQPSSWLDLSKAVSSYINERVPDADSAWAGARDIAAETISDDPKVRRETREKAMSWGILSSARLPESQDERRVYKLYYEFELRVDQLRPHQVLAINRGEAEKVLRVRIDVPERDWRWAIDRAYPLNPKSSLAAQLEQTIEDAAQRLLLPAIERDVRRALTEQAEEHAIEVFAANLRALLMQPPLAGFTVLGIDPGFRTGCKLAVVDPTGKALETGTIYPHPPQNQRERSLEQLSRLYERHGVEVIAIGNGTASRETEQLVAGLTASESRLRYLIVSEAGASVYSASPLARAELPDLDVSLRGAVSIARRVQDPMAELVKIDPQSIGVGMYQHDINQRNLDEALAAVVESVVNAVGVEVNTASPALLAYVSGIGPKLAEGIVAHREEQGPFRDRYALMQVKGLGEKSFKQAAGFLRLRESSEPLDATAIHPESYPVAKKVLAQVRIDLTDPTPIREQAVQQMVQEQPIEYWAKKFDTGIPTLSDILEQIARPGRDPREDLPAPILRSDVLTMEDLSVGMQLKGTVRNVVDFGAFVDIGVKHDGLLHRSRVPRGVALQVGDVITVLIMKIEAERGRISLGWGAG